MAVAAPQPRTPARAPAPAAAPTPAPALPPRASATAAPVMAGGPAIRLTSEVGAPATAGLPAAVRELMVAPGSGEPLRPDVQAALEARLDVPLYPVRVHTDARAGGAVAALGARAFTHGLHIFLGPRERPTDLALMAHEAAHVVQQQGRPVLQMSTGAGTADAFEVEARQTALTVGSGGRATVHGRTGGPRVQGIWPVDEAVDWLRDKVWGLLEDHAPGLVPILRQGVLGWLKDKLGDALQAIVEPLARPVRAIGEVVSGVRRHFTNLVGWMRDAGARIARNDCSAISEAADKIYEVFEGLASPVIDRVKSFATRVKLFFEDLWNRFGAPVWDLLKRIGGAVWEQIERIGRWIWEKTQPVRDWLSRAWRWLKNLIGIGEGEEGQNGILQWFQRKASAAWDWVMERIAPFKRQLLIVAAVLVMLSPAGPIIAIAGAAAGILRGIQWIRQHMRTRDAVVQQRGLLRGTILPAILGAIDRVSGVVRTIASTITGALRRVVAGLDSMTAAVAGIPIIGFASGLVGWIADGFRGLLGWAIEGVEGLATWLQSGLQRLGGFARLLVDTLEEIGRVVSNIFRLTSMLAGRLWNAIPKCIRDPFIDFFIPLILRQIPFFSELAASPEAWRQTRADVMQLIRQVFRDFDLLGAMRSAFRLVVRALRIPVDLVMQLLDKASRAWDAVLAAPLRFIENALKAVLLGIGRFMRNILSHLAYGISGWLFNLVSERGISPPSSWTDLRAVFGFVLDVLGISLEHVFELLERRLPRPVVDRLRQVVRFLTGAWEWVKVAVTEGPRGLWRMLTDRLRDLGTVVLEGAARWVMTRIIAIVSARLAALAASAGLSAVLEAIYAVYQAIQTAIEYARRILQILITVFDTVLQIAQGTLGPAAEMLERGLRLAMPVVIGFLANYAGLGGVGKRIREIIDSVRERVDNAILALIDLALRVGLGFLRTIQAGAQAVADWWRKRKDFNAADGHRHSLFFAGSARSARLMLASEFPDSVRARLQARIDNPTTNPNEPALINQAIPIIDAIDALIANQAAQTAATTGAPQTTDIGTQIESKLNALADILKQLSIDPPGLPLTNITYTTEPSVSGLGPRAKTVIANPLSKLAGNTRGSRASATNVPGYQLTPTGPPINYRNLYVRMHLISARTHGPGNEGWNLVMAPTGINTGPVNDAEMRIQSYLFHNRRPRTLKFDASVTYWDSGAPGLEDFPRLVRFQWESIDTFQPKITGSLPQPIDRPNFTPQAQYDLNTAIDAKLRELLDNNPSLVSAVRVLRPFADFPDFKRRMLLYLNGRGGNPPFNTVVRRMMPKTHLVLINGQHLTASDIQELADLIPTR